MRVGYYQYEPEFGAVAKNLEAIRAKLEQAEVDLMVLPELCVSGYQFVSAEEAWNLSEPVPDGPTTKMLVDVAKRRRMHIVAGLPAALGKVLQLGGDRRTDGVSRLLSEEPPVF